MNQKVLVIALRVIALILVILLAIALWGHYVVRPGIRARLKQQATPMSPSERQHILYDQ
ncbi:MAG: hypothetical protein K8I00_12365 [Candidatus Omnitrophica bacterium]|nr:hypothetical protein [Candidatus Omnitrophota bacterium]